MAIINFIVPKNLEKRVVDTIRERGFASKAEFFRFAAIYFMDILEKHVGSEEERFEYLTDALQKEIAASYRGKKSPSLKEQLADI
jgi:metal-responsive CopG/Arc/MetJ family transcriptional regulator